MASSSTLAFVQMLAPEDRARADFYAVLAAFYADAPSSSLLNAVAAAEPLAESPSGDLPVAWNRLIDACRVMDHAAAQQEYWDLFVGVGKSEVDLHATHWRGDVTAAKPLVELRGELFRLGLARKPQSSVFEDHLSALFETMRLLVEGDDSRRPVPIATQQVFFERHVGSWVPELCAALNRNSLANFYRVVGQFTDTFVAVERDALAIG